MTAARLGEANASIDRPARNSTTKGGVAEVDGQQPQQYETGARAHHAAGGERSRAESVGEDARP
jgi:hypothetical protein